LMKVENCEPRYLFHKVKVLKSSTTSRFTFPSVTSIVQKAVCRI
jgi:hypothetical protein